MIIQLKKRKTIIDASKEKMNEAIAKYIGRGIH